MPFWRSLIAKKVKAISEIFYRLILIGNFGNLLLLKQKRYSLVAFTGLEGVNNVFSHVSLILVATFSIFAKLLLTSFLA